MKKIFTSTIFLFVFLGLAFFGGKYWNQRQVKTAHAQPIVDNGFQPSNFPVQIHDFVIFIYGHDNGGFVEKTLKSVFSQLYTNFRLVYVDDFSKDGSDRIAKEYIESMKGSREVTFTKNEIKCGFLASLSHAIQNCQDAEILVILNGEDWLAHEWVLSSLNKYYAHPNLWVTYGQCLEFPSYRSGNARNYTTKEWAELRSSPFLATHLKTFYAGLYKKIAFEDLPEQVGFSAQTAELAMMFPMLEMAPSHFHFIPEILYIVNRRANPKIEREYVVKNEKQIRLLKPHQRLLEPLFSSNKLTCQEISEEAF